MRCRRTSARKGLSLLEVLVALAIFLIAFVVVCQMIQSGAQRGLRSKRLAQAGLLCEAKMNEIVAGVQPLQSVSGQALDGVEPGWVYSVNVQPQSWTSVSTGTSSGTGLSLVQVTVTWAGARGSQPVEYTLARLVLDPSLRVPLADPTPTTSSSGS